MKGLPEALPISHASFGSAATPSAIRATMPLFGSRSAMAAPFINDLVRMPQCRLFLCRILHCPGQHRQPAPSCSVSKNGGQVPDIIRQKLGSRPPKREHAFDPAFGAAFILFAPHQDRKSVVKGKRGSVRVSLGGRRSFKKKN